MEPNIKSIPYEKYRERRPVMTASIDTAKIEQATPQPPVPAALDALSERIEELSAMLDSLDDRLNRASAAPCPEPNELCAGAQLAHGTSEFALRIYDSRGKIDNIINRVRRMTNNLEI
jgi:hypothetical protein